MSTNDSWLIWPLVCKGSSEGMLPDHSRGWLGYSQGVTPCSLQHQQWSCWGHRLHTAPSPHMPGLVFWIVHGMCQSFSLSKGHETKKKDLYHKEPSILLPHICHFRLPPQISLTKLPDPLADLWYHMMPHLNNCFLGSLACIQFVSRWSLECNSWHSLPLWCIVGLVEINTWGHPW